MTSSAGVTVSQMKERGFDVGTHIARINDEDEHVFGGVKLAGNMVAGKRKRRPSTRMCLL
jgi:hypothetical protein